QDAELAPVAGLGQGGMPDVKIEVEPIVERPIGIAEAQRQLHDLAPEEWRRVEVAFDVSEDLLEAKRTSARDVLLVVDVDHRAVRARIRAIDMKEQRVLTAQFFHRCRT